MALCNKLGSLVRQGFLAGGVHGGPVSTTSSLNLVRYMATKLFIGGLSYGTDDQSLKEAFNNFGNVTEARVITDRDSGRSKGFGFVNFDCDEAAESALSSMDGQDLHGRNIRVSYANERPASGFRGGRGGNSAGGFGGGGYGGPADLSFSTTDDSLRAAFTSYGKVVDVLVMRDKDTGLPRGFGYVTFDNAEQAASALSSMNDQDVDGRRIRVSYASEKSGGSGGGSA